MAVSNEVRMAELATAISNSTMRAAVVELIRENPRIVETVRRQMSAIYGGSDKMTPAELVEAFNRTILPFLTQAAEIGIAEAPALHAAQSALLGQKDDEVLGVLESAAATGVLGAAAAGGGARSLVAQRAQAAAVRTALEYSGTDVNNMASNNTSAVIEYQQRITERITIRQTVSIDARAVDETGALMSTRLRGPDPQRPQISATTEDAEAFLLERGENAAAEARREAEAAASTVVYGDDVKFVLVSDAGSCKMCKTISGRGFLDPDWKFIHKDCKCSVRAVTGEDDPVYKHNKEVYGPVYEAAKAKATPNLPADSGPNPADSDRYFAYTLKMAATLPD